jgi:hypothetical protein
MFYAHIRAHYLDKVNKLYQNTLIFPLKLLLHQNQLFVYELIVNRYMKSKVKFR